MNYESIFFYGTHSQRMGTFQIGGYFIIIWDTLKIHIYCVVGKYYSKAQAILYKSGAPLRHSYIKIQP